MPGDGVWREVVGTLKGGMREISVLNRTETVLDIGGIYTNLK